MREQKKKAACDAVSPIMAAACCAALWLAPAAQGAPAAGPIEVFSTDFDSGLPAEVSAPGAGIEGVQGFTGLGPAGHAFGGSFLRYTSVPILPTTLTLTNLPAHDSVNVDFLLGLIDSWDGTELLQIRVDGALLFNHWFQLASGDESDYVAPAGGLLSHGVELGFSQGAWYAHDRAYDLSVEPAFHSIPHTSSGLTVEWTLGAVSGPAASQWQGGTDESWAIDQLRVSVNNSTAGVEPGSAPRLSLAAAGPNPAPRGALAIRFTLSSAHAAALDIVDAAGRRVFSREVGALGAGVHQLSVGREAHLAPGVYMVRLAQDDDVRQQRAVVLD